MFPTPTFRISSSVRMPPRTPAECRRYRRTLTPPYCGTSHRYSFDPVSSIQLTITDPSVASERRHHSVMGLMSSVATETQTSSSATSMPDNGDTARMNPESRLILIIIGSVIAAALLAGGLLSVVRRIRYVHNILLVLIVYSNRLERSWQATWSGVYRHVMATY